MHSQSTYNRSIWQDKDWIVTRFRILLFVNLFQGKGRRQITLFLRSISCLLPLLSITLILRFGPFPLSVTLDYAHFSHKEGVGDHKGLPTLLIIIIFASLIFYQPLIPPSQRLLNILIDSLPLISQHESSNVIPSRLLLIISSFLTDI